MKVISKNKKKMKDLKPGDVFDNGYNLYIRCTTASGGEVYPQGITGLLLASAECMYFSDLEREVEVFPNATLTLEGV